MTLPLFDEETGQASHHTEWLGPQACVLRGHALTEIDGLLSGIESVSAQAPFRHLLTPGGATMSVAMTNCGHLGWVSDRRGYRYCPDDPSSGQRWPDEGSSGQYR